MENNSDNTSNIIQIRAHKILDTYDGYNNFIVNLREKYRNQKHFNLTRSQCEYIVDYHQLVPKIAKKWVEIDEYFAKKFREERLLPEIPKKIYIEKLLVEKDKSFHVWGKMIENENLYAFWIPKSAIIPTHTEREVSVDYEKYVNRPPLEHQKIAIEKLVGNDRFILADDMGTGKGVTNKTLIYTHLGTKKMGEIIVGDKVVGSDGKPYNVTGVFPQGKKETYKVTFNDGYNVITDDEHLWLVMSPNYGKNRKNERRKKSLILSTKQLYEGGKIKIKGDGYNKDKEYEIETYYKSPNGNNKWQIPIVEPIQFENNNELPIEPYLLGLCLGDGHFNKDGTCVLVVGKDDYDELFGNFNLVPTKCRENLLAGKIKLKKELIDIGLHNSRSHNKFIPDIYKYSSVENRLAVLQGLMDTDGFCALSKNNVFKGTEYSTISEKLCDDVCEIVQTLGGIARKSSRRSFYKKDGKRVECSRSYRVKIKLPSGMNPFRLKRKAERYIEPKKYPTGRYIKNIEKVGEDYCTCISVDSPDNLYVAEHCIVTHNTTSTAIAALESEVKKTLIVCPASLKINWMRELRNYTDRSISIIEGKKWESADFVIINYDILKNFHDIKDRENSVILNEKFDLIVADECHYLKNKQSARTKLFNDLSKGTKKLWLLSGTPMTSRPIDYFNLLELVKSPVAMNWMAYVIRYCEGYQFRAGNRKVWNVNGASNLEELRDRTKHQILRRMKEDILDLPDKIITPIYLRLKSNEYEELMGEYYEWVKNSEEAKSLSIRFSKIMKVRQVIAEEKVKSTIEIAENIIEQNKKVIIFTNFTNTLNRIVEHFGKSAVKLDGSMSKQQRQYSVDQFQENDKIKVFVGNIKAAAVGITLTSSEAVIMNDLSFVPADHSQAEDRAFRYGQKSNVLVYYPIFENTIEGVIYDILSRKKKIIGTVMGDYIDNGDAAEEIMNSI